MAPPLLGPWEGSGPAALRLAWGWRWPHTDIVGLFKHSPAPGKGEGNAQAGRGRPCRPGCPHGHQCLLSPALSRGQRPRAPPVCSAPWPLLPLSRNICRTGLSPAPSLPYGTHRLCVCSCRQGASRAASWGTSCPPRASGGRGCVECARLDTVPCGCGCLDSMSTFPPRQKQARWEAVGISEDPAAAAPARQELGVLAAHVWP